MFLNLDDTEHLVDTGIKYDSMYALHVTGCYGDWYDIEVHGVRDSTASLLRRSNRGLTITASCSKR